MITKKLLPFGTTVFAEMTALAREHNAINLAQGFPDFEGPPQIVEAAVEAGKHSFIEKPVAVDPPGARRIMAAGEKATTPAS